MKNLKEILTMKQFEDIKSNEKISICIFSADWCIDCKNVEVYLDETIEDFSVDYDFYYINYDKFSELFNQFNIRGIPNFLLFKNNQLIGQIGNGKTIDQDELEDYLNEIKQKYQ